MGILNWVRSQWDRASALVALILGLLAMLLGWIGVSGHAYVADQMPYVVSGALFGIFMVGIAAAIWISADLRDEWRELRGIRMELRAQRVSRAAEQVNTVADADHTQTLSALGTAATGYSVQTPGAFS